MISVYFVVVVVQFLNSMSVRPGETSELPARQDPVDPWPATRDSGTWREHETKPHGSHRPRTLVKNEATNSLCMAHTRRFASAGQNSAGVFR
jgi:hypothetical protein